MNEVKINKDIHESLKALYLSVINSIKKYGYKGEYFLYKKSDKDESGFVKMWNSTYVNDYTTEQEACSYLAFRILNDCDSGFDLILDKYMNKDWYSDFWKSAIKLIDPENKRRIRCSPKNDMQEAIYHLEAIIKKYFKNYKRIMKQEKIDRKSYDDFFVIRGE